MPKMYHEAADGTGEMRILDHTGDTRMAWDKAKPETVAAALELYNNHIKKGFLAFKLPNAKGEKPTLLKEFDPNADIILSPSITPG